MSTLLTFSSTSRSEPSSPGRLDFIEALRGYAALFVFCYHLALIPNPDLELPKWAGKFLLTGGTGVTLFFVVSAFTLTLSMQRRENETNHITKFYIRRFFRIAPLFYVWIILTLIRDRLMFSVMRPGGTIFLSVIFGFNLIPGKHEGFVSASWTLGVEMIFYLLFPLIYRFVNDIWKALGAFLAALTISSIYTFLITNYMPLDGQVLKSFIQFSFLHQLPTFMFGIFAYFFYDKFIVSKKINNSLAFLFTSASFFGYSALLDGRLNFFLDGLYWQTIIYGMFLLGLGAMSLSFFVNRFSRFMGKISYSFYLNHPTLILLLAPIYKTLYMLELPATILYGICLFLTGGILTLISFGTYRLIEQPGIRLGSRLTKINQIETILSWLKKNEKNEAV